MEELKKDNGTELLNQLNNVVEALMKTNEEKVPENVTEIEFTSTKIFGDLEQTKAMFTDYGKYFGEVTNPKNTKVNPFHKSNYAPLDEVMNTIRPVMAKYGLSLIQIPTIKNGKVLINSMLTHKSGAYMTFESLEMPMQKTDAQGIGGAITYGRRYNASAIGGVMSEEDDDGNSASGLPNTPKQSVPQNTPQKQTPQKPIQNKELTQLVSEIDKLATTKAKTNKDDVVKAIEDITKEAYTKYKSISDVSIAKQVKESLEKVVVTKSEEKVEA